MGNRKIRKMPEQIGIPEGFYRSLERPREIKNDRHKIKRQGIARSELVPGCIECHEKIGRARRNGNQHTDTGNNSCSLQSPRDGTEYKMMRPDQGIKKGMRPERQCAEAVRINRFVELLGKKIVHKPEIDHHEPHPDRLMHVISLRDGFPNAILPYRNIADQNHHNNKHKA